MKKQDEFKTRLQSADVANQKNPNHKNAAKIFIHQSIFLQSGFTTGHLCHVQAATAPGDGPAHDSTRREAVAWPQPDKNVAVGIASVSRAFQKTAGLELGDSVRVTPAAAQVPDAGPVILRELTPDSNVSAQDQQRWLFHIESRLESAEYVFPGMLYEDIFLYGSRRSFAVVSVNGSTNSVAKYSPGVTAAQFFDEEANATGGRLEIAGLPGMTTQTAALNNYFSLFDRDLTRYPRLLGSCAIVIAGSHGTGKTTLLESVAATNWGRVVRLGGAIKPSAVQDHFRAALDQSTPTVILIDDLVDLVGPDQPNRRGFILAIGEGLDALAQRARQLGRRPRVVVVASCLDYLADVPHELQRRSRLRAHVTLPIPDAAGRKDILRHYRPDFPPDLFDRYIEDLGDRTHAYTGDDLDKVIDHAMDVWRARAGHGPLPEEGTYLDWQDVKQALHEVRPTAMHDINLKPPTVRWSDIGGYEDVKRGLQRALQQPKNPKHNLFIPPKGVLMYGPPGCSKTMTAQAMATESGFNFFAVKGGELLNMYVGETERSIRRLFARAREASPSIIFFDEIDSIAGSRSSPTSSAGGSGGSGVQALTALLTEMDGFEQLGDVFVLAATNKPDSLDPALLRPGRFDELIYVPLPDAPAREAIFASKARQLRFHSAPSSSFSPNPAANGLDTAELAALSEGYSGAEIARLCDLAFKDTDRAEATPAAPAGDGDGEEQVLDAMPVLRAAISSTPRRVTRDVLEHFERWQQGFR